MSVFSLRNPGEGTIRVSGALMDELGSVKSIEWSKTGAG